MTGATAAEEPDQPAAVDELLDRKEQKRAPRQWQPFTLDGHPVQVREPKGAIAVHIEIGMQSPDPQKVLDAFDLLIDTIFDEASADHIRDRLEDPDDDDFDYEDLGATFRALGERWGSNRGAAPRPTGRSRGSAQRSQRTTRGSRAKSRSQAGT